MTEIIESRTPEQWASVVRADLGQAVAGFIAAGEHLRTALSAGDRRYIERLNNIEPPPEWSTDAA